MSLNLKNNKYRFFIVLCIFKLLDAQLRIAILVSHLITSSGMNLISIFVLLFASCSCTESVCTNILDQGLNKEQEKYILAKHNKVRKLIANGKVPGQPRGINLKRLKYDASIAKEAQRITDTCVFSHMEVKDNRFPGVGQNLYLERCSEKSSRKNLGRAVQAWFEEHKFYNYSTIRDVPYFKKIGHYTQLVWANTEYLGCGYTSYSDEEMMADYKYITCHYGPGGNILDELPYETGESGCENLC